MLGALREFLRQRSELHLSEAAIKQNWDYITRRLRAELITAALGIDAADQFLLGSDPQVMRAITEVTKGK